jgi:hypothetical protein
MSPYGNRDEASSRAGSIKTACTSRLGGVNGRDGGGLEAAVGVERAMRVFGRLAVMKWWGWHRSTPKMARPVCSAPR